MSDVSVAGSAGRATAARAWVVRQRALLAVEAVWLLFAANFNVGFLWGGDAQVPYTFLRRLFGAHVHAIGYQFGLALFEAPFYAVARGLQRAGVETIRTHPTTEALIAIGAALYVALALGIVFVLLRALGLRHPAPAALLALFGSPLFYYGTFSPGQTHAVDTLLATVAISLVYLGTRTGWPAPLAVATGVVLGAAPTVRYLEAAFGVALVAMLALRRRWRPAILIAASGAVTLGAFLLAPLALGVHIFAGGASPERAIAITPLGPIHMLVSLKRGLFVWTPVTLLAAIGYVRLVRRRPELREFLVTVAAMCVLLVCAQAIIPFWTAGWSFSQRYLTALFPAVALGLGGLLEWRPRIATSLAGVGVAWSLFLCLTMQTVGFDDHRDTAVTLARRAGGQTPGGYLYGVWHISHLRRLGGG